MTQLGSNDKSEDKGLTVPLEVPSLPVLSLPTLNSDYCFFTLLSQPRERAVSSFFTWSPTPGSKRARIGRKGNGLGVCPGGLLWCSELSPRSNQVWVTQRARAWVRGAYLEVISGSPVGVGREDALLTVGCHGHRGRWEGWRAPTAQCARGKEAEDLPTTSRPCRSHFALGVSDSP